MSKMQKHKTGLVTKGNTQEFLEDYDKTNTSIQLNLQIYALKFATKNFEMSAAIQLENCTIKLNY